MLFEQFRMFRYEKGDKFLIDLTELVKAYFKDFVDNKREGKPAIFLDCVMNQTTNIGGQNFSGDIYGK